MKIKQLLVSAICGLVSVLIVFVVVPKLCVGWPDPVWITICILAPVAVAILLLEGIWHISPAYVWVGLPIQYGMLFLFQAPISDMIGMPLDGLGGFSFLFYAAVWPLAVTAVQFLALLFVKRKTKCPVP